MDDRPASRAMLLSVHPRHAGAILAGNKTTELRRTRPTAPAGTPVLIYATSPVAAIVATCRLAAVQSADAGALWPEVARSSAVSREDFDAYFAGARSAHALELSDVARLAVPVTLAHMRTAAGGFQPPQTWRLLDSDELSRLTAAHPASALLDALLAERPAPAAPAHGLPVFPSLRRAASRRIPPLLAAVPTRLAGAARAAGLPL